VGKLVGKIDIREYGSGNAGTTNIVRTLGTKYGLLVFTLDILKAVAAYLTCSLLFDGAGTFINPGQPFVQPGFYAALGTIIGHDFPFFMQFRGGKGSASGLGIILCVNLPIALITFATGIITVGVSRYISLASLLMSFIFFVLLLIFKYDAEAVFLAFILFALSAFQHRGNISRLIKGGERKFTFKPKIDK
jgi:glycerol-3-phosphate acyltransferase PlsY